MVEIKLGNASYDFSSLDEMGRAKIQAVSISEDLDEETLQELGVELGPFEKGTETQVKIYTHLRVINRIESNNSDACIKEGTFSEHTDWEHENADIVFVVTDEDRENVTDIVIQGNDECYQKFETGEETYFLPPRYWRRVKGEYVSQNYSCHYTAACREKIFVHYVDGTYDVVNLESVASIEEQDYRDMLCDLFDIEERLVEDNKASGTVGTQAVSEDDDESSDLKKAKETVKEIEEAFGKLKYRMEKDLIEEYEKIHIRKIKNMTPSNILEYRLSGQPYVHGSVFRESSDIYENRIIKKYLQNYQKYLGCKAGVADFLSKKLDTEDRMASEYLVAGTQFADDYATAQNTHNEIMKARRQRLEKQKRESYEWKKLEKRIKVILEDSAFDNISVKGESLHRTNIFASNPVYKTFYRIMIERLNDAKQLYFDAEDGITVKKLEKLYENWCLIKLLYIMIVEYGFNFDGRKKGSESFEVIRKAIRGIIENGSLEGNSFKMKRAAAYESNSNSVLKTTDRYIIDAELFYNVEYKFDEREGSWKNNLPEAMESRETLRPDFVLKLKTNQIILGNTRVFVFDSKYRTKNSLTGENGKSQWFSDLFTVALQKYYVELNRGPRVKNIRDAKTPVWGIDGSFILHSNDKMYISGWDYEDMNPRAYCGQRFRRVLKEVKQLYPEASWRQKLSTRVNYYIERYNGFTDEEKEDMLWHPSKYGDLSRLSAEIDDLENRIGSFCLTPGSDYYLKVAFAMIFERWFGIYKMMCFKCGHEITTDDVTVGSTRSGVETYAMNCPECGEFWKQTICAGCHRKIGKHIINYLGKTGYQKWNRECPNCKAGWIVD